MKRSCRAPQGRVARQSYLRKTELSQVGFPKIGNRDLPALFAGAGRLGAQPFQLALGHGEADLSDPVELDADDRLGVEAVEIDDGGGFAPLDSFQIALAGLEPDHGLFAVEARQRMTL